MENDVCSQEPRYIRVHDRVLVALACCLCVTAQLKIFEIQYLEPLYAADMVAVLLWLCFRPIPLRAFRPLFRIARNWMLFSVFALLLALLALRQDFFMESISPLKRPFIVTIARLGELVLDLFAMLFLAERFRRNPQLCRFGCFLFYLVGMASCVFGLLSEVALRLGRIFLGGATPTYRMVGFNNEPGPFGAYLVAVIFLTAALHSQRWIGRFQYLASMAVLILCLFASLSVSAMLEIVVCIVLVVVMRMNFAKAVAVCVLTLALSAVIFQSLGLRQRIVDYFGVASRYPTISKLRPTDANTIMGRISGIFLAPKMIEAHPLAGIGLGNYPIVRDDPKYRQGSPIVATSLDSPSLGFVDYIVDLGIPLFLYVTWVELQPAIALMRRGASGAVISLMLILPVSTWFGAHLNFTYMWIVGAMGLGIFYGRPSGATLPVELSAPLELTRA